MVAGAEQPGHRANWQFARLSPSWIRLLVTASLASAVVGVIVGGLYFGRVISPGSAEADVMALALLGLAGVGGAAALVSGKANGALSSRLDILCRALDGAREARLIVTSDGDLGYANDGYERLFPGPGDAALDRIEQALIPEEDALEQFHRLRRCALAGTRATATLRLRAADAGAAWFEIAVYPIPGYSGYSFWALRDVSAHHETAVAVRDERNMLSDLLDNAPIGFFSVDHSGCFRFINRTLAEWLGSTAAEIIASSARLHDFLASPPPAATPPYQSFAEPGEGADRGEIALRTRRGRAVPVWIAQSIARSGPELYTRSVVCDLTPERGWKSARESPERFRRCFINAPVGIALLDRFGRFEEANRAVGELFGAAAENLKGRELLTLVSEDDRGRITARLNAAAGGSANPEPIQVRSRRLGDKTMLLYLGRLDDRVEGVAAPQLEPSDGLTLHFIDITEQKNLELQFANRRRCRRSGNWLAALLTISTTC